MATKAELEDEVKQLNQIIVAHAQNETALREELAALKKVQALVVGQEGATIAELRERDGTKRLVNPGDVLVVADDGYIEFVAGASVEANTGLKATIDDVAEGLYDALAEQVEGEAVMHDKALTPFGVMDGVVRLLCVPWQDAAVREAAFADVFKAYDMFDNVSLGPVGVLMNERAAETELRLQVALAMSDEEVETLRALRSSGLPGGIASAVPVFNEAPPFGRIDDLKPQY